MTDIATDILVLCELAEKVTQGTPLAEEAANLKARLQGPLRVAIAGRVKAGKSTLLNALVGERLAPTDAGECTKVICCFKQDDAYEVDAVLHDGATRALPFTRGERGLEIDLAGLAPDDFERIDVGWPSSALRDITLIDTPGLASLDDSNSRRTRDFLETDGTHAADADAVIYLMRHMHQSDVQFLDAFMDRTVTAASPINTLAVLSRADEIGAGRPDALDSAARIAQRYREHETVRSLTATVVPVAGLLAETGLTLREDEAAALRKLAWTPADELERMLMSADYFCELSSSDLTVEIRRNLLHRLGMYGLRYLAGEIVAGNAQSASDLARLLVERSGLGELRRLIAGHFLPRARILQARTALVAVRGLAHRLAETDPNGASELDAEAERIEANRVEFAQLRVSHLVLTGAAKVSDAERAEVQRVTLAPSTDEALGVSSTATNDERMKVVLDGIERWRSRATDPLASPALAEASETMARSYEAMYASLSS